MFLEKMSFCKEDKVLAFSPPGLPAAASMAQMPLGLVPASVPCDRHTPPVDDISPATPSGRDFLGEGEWEHSLEKVNTSV